MSELFGKKYRVTTETSELLQQAVFEAGGCWWAFGQQIRFGKEPYLFISHDGVITFEGNSYNFDSYPQPEGFIEVVKTVKLVQPPKTEQELRLEAVLVKIDEFKSKIDELKSEAEKLKGHG